MSRIHETWPRVPLEGAFPFQEGPGLRKWQFRDAGVKVLNVSNIDKSGRLMLENSERYIDPAEAAGRYSHFLVDAGDLVIASSGISFDTDGFLRTRGVFVEPHHLPLCMNTSTIRFKKVRGKSDLRFLRYWIDSIDFRRQISKLVTGSAQQNFGPSHLRAIQIPLPPLPEQRRIAAILDEADALRAKRRAALAQLDEMARAIFVEMFGDVRSNSHGWPIVPVSDYVADFQGGRSLEADTDNRRTKYRVLKVSAVTSSLFKPLESKPLPEGYVPPQEHFVRINDLLFSRANTTELVGAVAYVDDDPSNLVLSDKIWRFVWRQSKAIEPLFVWALFQIPAVREEIGRRATGTSGSMKNISQAKLLAMSTIMPPLEYQTAFVERFQMIKEIRRCNDISLNDLNSLFAALQHRAFRGEL